MKKGFYSQILIFVTAVSLGTVSAVFLGSCSGVGSQVGAPTVPTGSPESTGTPNPPTASAPAPAAPPAPPSEIPLLQVAADISISVQTTISASAPTPDLSALTGTGPLQVGISFSSNLVNFTQLFLEQLFVPINQVVIPVGTGVTQIQVQISSNVVVFMDFSGFDLSKSLSAQGKRCSGNTTVDADHPACMQLWLDQGNGFAPYLEWIITDYPRPGNPGSGELRGFSQGIFHVTVAYNHNDPANKANEMFFGYFDPNSKDPNNPNVILSIHAIVQKQGADDATALKTVNGNNFTGESGEGFGRWKEGGDLWEGSVFTQDDQGNTTNDFSNVCGNISTATAADPPDQCEQNGITSTDLSFLPFATFGDLTLIDFQNLPPP